MHFVFNAASRSRATSNSKTRLISVARARVLPFGRDRRMSMPHIVRDDIVGARVTPPIHSIARRGLR
jgi:hypothetical protein